MRKKADDSLTKVRLLETGARLFARYGFDATTTRMIAAEAGLNIATMAFHFGNKENFFHQVLLDTANHIRSYYEPLGRQVQSLREAGELDREKAWELICRYVDLVLSIVANMQEPYTLSLLFHEQNQRLFPDRPITRQEMMTIIGRCLDLPDENGLGFADDGDIAFWALEAAARTSAAGLFQGGSGNALMPLATSTRAEAATVLSRVVEMLEQ